MSTAIPLNTYLRELPKVELHLHLEGAVAAKTFVDLANKNGIPVPAHAHPDALYDYGSLVDFLKIYGLVAQSVRDSSDFYRITYECLDRCSKDGARYVELFFSPEAHREFGVEYSTMLDGICSALNDIETDTGLICRLVPAINRELGPARAKDFVKMVLDERRHTIIGIGLDYDEAHHPPAPFVEAFNLAKRAGLHVTAHAGEVGPAAHVRESLSVLGCERIDHGYHVVDDESLMRHCRDLGVVFTVCPSTTTYTTIWRDLSSPDHAIKRMIDAGLKVMINSDDPPMFKTSLAREYELLADKMHIPPSTFKTFVMNGIDGSWLDDTTKKEFRSQWSAEIDDLLSRLSL